jgi:hypothetical protein
LINHTSVSTFNSVAIPYVAKLTDVLVDVDPARYSDVVVVDAGLTVNGPAPLNTRLIAVPTGNPTLSLVGMLMLCPLVAVE